MDEIEMMIKSLAWALFFAVMSIIGLISFVIVFMFNNSRSISLFIYAMTMFVLFAVYILKIISIKNKEGK